MSFTYSITLATAKDQVRFLISDTSPMGDHEVEDEEITGILAIEPNVLAASCLIATSRAASHIDRLADAESDSKKVGRLELKALRDRVSKWKDICEMLDARLDAAGTGAAATPVPARLVGVTVTEADNQDADTDLIGPRFRLRPPQEG